MGNVYCTADSTAEAMEELGAGSQRLPDWLVTAEIRQKCGFDPQHKHKLRPDCMIVEVPKAGPPNKRSRSGRTGDSSQVAGRPRKIWVVELGYSSDTRYLDNLAEKKLQHAQLCELLTTEGYDVHLLQIILGSAGRVFKCLQHAAKELEIPPARRKTKFSKIHLHSVHTLQNLVSQRRYLERPQTGTEARGRIKGR